ncbi:hypothetical protein ACFW5I_28975 [Streptomyces sp. NPDC058818]|uniref:hypothetical protein n=1 Tax=Streptomyces sp. NPDC058818 TaxID=3346640 RepID=UPI0036740719
MSTTPRSRRRPRVPAPGAAAPRQPVDHAKAGRRAVRRRATGMTAAEAAAALEDARLQQRIDRDREDLADDERGPAEVAEWQRIAQLLATTGGTYDPKGDAVVQDELAADQRAAEAEQQRLQEQQLAARADELAALARAGRLDRTVETRPGDELARELLVHRGDYHPVVDSWLAQAFADRSGHYADPATLTAAADSLPDRVRAHAALLAALARTGAPVADGDLEFVGRLAQADPDATNALAAWLDRDLAPADWRKRARARTVRGERGRPRGGHVGAVDQLRHPVRGSDGRRPGPRRLRASARGAVLRGRPRSGLQPDLLVPARPEAVLHGVRRLRRVRAVPRTARLAAAPELTINDTPLQRSREAVGAVDACHAHGVSRWRCHAACHARRSTTRQHPSNVRIESF